MGRRPRGQRRLKADISRRGEAIHGVDEALTGPGQGGEGCVRRVSSMLR